MIDLSVKNSYKIYKIDVIKVFLYKFLNEEIYII